jgi:antitoxin component YwqK of YwqJK toxin-antitoxin module
MMKNITTTIALLLSTFGFSQYDIEIYRIKNDSVKSYVYNSLDEIIRNSRSCITDWSSGEGECKDRYGAYIIEKEGEKILEVYKNGNMRREVSIRKKVREGLTIIYHPISGIKFSELYYSAGKLWNVKYFDSNGEVISNGDFIDGTGILTFYRFSGTVAQELEYKKGQPNGSCTYYYSSKKVMESGSYKFGRPDGYWREYNTSGIEVQIAKMAMGLLVKTTQK